VIHVGSVRWRCPPVIAAVQVESEAWVMAPPVIALDLERDKELYKVIRISTPPDDADLLYVVCTSDGDSGTRIEFHLYDDLSSESVAIAKDFTERVIRRGDAGKFTPRKVGFVR